MVDKSIKQAVNDQIEEFQHSPLYRFVDTHGPYVIKFVQSQWAESYLAKRPLKISETPALTWGTATYVTPLAFPLSSALYGRVGLVSDFEPKGWRVFDATKKSARCAYINWAQSQPTYSELLFTVHSTYANHFLRNKFRKTFKIDCVLFHPDQEAEVHTDRSAHVWMAVTDWNSRNRIRTTMSKRFANAKFVVLIDEDFDLTDASLPIQVASRKIEKVTERIPNHSCMDVGSARSDPNLPKKIVSHYQADEYLHVYISP